MPLVIVLHGVHIGVIDYIVAEIAARSNKAESVLASNEAFV